MTLFRRAMLRPDVTSTAVPEGVYVAHHDDGFLLRNPQAGPLVARLLSLLDGVRFEQETEASLPEKVRPMFRSLLSGLEGNGMLTEGPTGLVSPATADSELGRFARSLSEDWERRVHLLLTSALTVGGRASTACHIVASLEAHGVAVQTGQTDPTSESVDLTIGDGRRGVHGQFVGNRYAFARVASADVSSWREAVASAIPGGESLEPQIERVGGAATAHEIILAHLGDESPSAQVKLVERDGSVRLVDLASAGLLPSPVRTTDELPSAGTGLTPPWPDADGPIRRGRDVDPAFPLAHTELVVNGAGQEGIAVIEWGRNPAEADRRALAAACEAIAASRHGGSAAHYAAIQPGGAAPPANSMIARLFAMQARRYELNPDARIEADLGMLLRIARLHWNALPEISFAASGDIHLARATLCGISTMGVAPNLEGAAAEAVGAAISTLQTGRAPSSEARLRAVCRSQAPGVVRELDDGYPEGLRVFAT